MRLFFEVPSRGAELVLSPGVVIALVGLGLVMGVASGLFGIGGGVILVPVLIAFFGIGDLLAKGTSLLAMIPTSITGSVANIRAGMVRLGDGLIVGAGRRGRRASAASRSRSCCRPGGGGAVRGVHPDRASSQLVIRAIRRAADDVDEAAPVRWCRLVQVRLP